MNLGIKISFFSVVLVSLFTGCTYQRSVGIPPTGLPEEIFESAQLDSHSAYKVGVFVFTEPSYAPGMGKSAAQCLTQELMRNKVFSNVTLEPCTEDNIKHNLVNTARKKKYDLIITGDLLYYFEGSNFQPSRVEEKIRVIRVSRGTLKTLWHAKAVEIVMPAASSDYIFIKFLGAPPPPAIKLMEKNAIKFCKMLLNHNPAPPLNP